MLNKRCTDGQKTFPKSPGITSSGPDVAECDDMHGIISGIIRCGITFGKVDTFMTALIDCQ